ncbi:MAG: restriction endonuclease subunit S [Blastomonas sp.]|uniref:restriction endonuclease subunit S n=1 Tax=Blastomonas sp. TaxID=1909299 RepID=UPI0025847866|nr:restriction endonuclease subunit S [Blastomonas sp.]MCO5792831.1 restriction endonuclease subunit S [Blastomonas sp.]
MSWPTYSLDQLGELSRGRSRHRPRDAAHLYGGPYPFIQTGDVKATPLYLNKYSQTYSEAGLAQSKLWPKGTLCITIAANIAETAILDIDACFPDSVIGFVANEEKADTKFIKYLFDTVLKSKIRGVSRGAAQDNLSQEKLLSFKFPVPALTIQKRISTTLCAYDDLIENSGRRSALLEEAARLLYREWFVHLRFPGHEHAKITNGVPEGWEQKTLGDVVATNPESYKAGKLPEVLNYIDISSVSTGKIDSKTEMAAFNAPGRARRKAQNGDVIWSNVRPNLRAYALVTDPAENDVFSTGFTVLRSKLLNPFFMYFFVTSNSFVDHLVNHATGTSYPAVRPEDFEKAEIVVPPVPLLDAFAEICRPQFQQIAKLHAQSLQAVKARDMLLPRLMDGRIEV